ncbi:TPA: hypothetical protein N2D99_002424 [Clostridium botulinum]|nr:hypothetical protein [Clostridium botulinum]
MGKTFEQLSKKEQQKLINSINKFFRRESIYRQLQVSTKFLLPHKKYLRLELNIGGGSYYDGTKIVIGLPNYMLTKSRKEIFSALKALHGHECEHGNSSDLVVLKKYLNEVSEYLCQKYNFHSSIAQKVGHYVQNSVEDGRIEKRLVNRLKGFLKHIKYFRGMWWKAQPVQGESEISDFLFAICTVATTGLYPLDWENYYKDSRAEEMVEKIRPLIIRGINDSSHQICCNHCKEIIEVIGDYIAELLQDQNMMAHLMEMAIDNDYSTSESNQSEQPCGGNSTSTHFRSEKANKKQKKDNQKQDQQQGSQGESSEEDCQDQQHQGQGSSQIKSSKKEDNKEEDKEAQGSEESKDKDKQGEKEGKCGQASDEDVDKKNEEENQTGNGNGNNRDNEENFKEEDDGDNQSNNNNKSNNNNQNNSQDNDKDNDETNVGCDSDFVDQELDKIRQDALEEAERALSNADKEDDQEAKRQAKEAKEDKANTITPEELDKIAKEYKDDYFPHFRIIKFNSGQSVELSTEIKKEAKKFKKEIEDIFKDKKVFNSRHKKRGVLDTTTLWQIGVKDYNVFSKKGNPKDTDYAIYVLIDGSGSMRETVDRSTSKWFYASKAGAIIEEGIKEFIPFKIATFSSGYEENVHYIVSNFQEKGKENKAWSFYHRYSPGNGNKDGHSIRVATAELMKRPERNKLLIVLSDGLPSAYNSDQRGQSDVRKSVREARKNNINVVSICFGNEAHRAYTMDAYKAMYQTSIISCDPKNISKELIRVLKKEITK